MGWGGGESGGREEVKVGVGGGESGGGEEGKVGVGRRGN